MRRPFIIPLILGLLTAVPAATAVAQEFLRHPTGARVTEWTMFCFGEEDTNIFAEYRSDLVDAFGLTSGQQSQSLSEREILFIQQNDLECDARLITYFPVEDPLIIPSQAYAFRRFDEAGNIWHIFSRINFVESKLVIDNKPSERVAYVGTVRKIVPGTPPK